MRKENLPAADFKHFGAQPLAASKEDARARICPISRTKTGMFTHIGFLVIFSLLPSSDLT